jgi:c-di-GMP-binding flagellar brake protein YcgR
MKEKRKSSRQKVPFKLTVLVRSLFSHGATDDPEKPRKSRTLKARVIDLSRDGAGLFTRVFSFQPYKPGQHVKLDVELSDRSTIPAEGEVRWINAHPSKRGHLYGVYFTHIDPKDHTKMRQFLLELDRVL